jgi:hypothetical protein
MQTRRHYFSMTQKIVNGKGQRNIVQINSNGPAVKIVEKLASTGKVLKRKTRKLSTKEKKAILQGTFVPGLWRNCTFGNC